MLCGLRGCIGRGSIGCLDVAVFFGGPGLSSLDARRVGGLRGAGQRLRSGAFAPDFPLVIFVTACGSSFRFPRAYRRPARPGRPPRRALPGAIWRQPGRTVCLGFSPAWGNGGGSCGARSRPAARAAFGSLRGVLRRDVFRFACRWLGLCSALGRLVCGISCGVVPCRPRGRPRGLGGVLRFVMPLRAGEERACGACLKPAARAAF